MIKLSWKYKVALYNEKNTLKIDLRIYNEKWIYRPDKAMPKNIDTDLLYDLKGSELPLAKARSF